MHLAHLIQTALRKHHLSWPLIDQLESAYLFYDQHSWRPRINLTLESSSMGVIIDTPTLALYGRGLLLHNHPNGILLPSPEDHYFVAGWKDSHPDIHYGVITPDYSILLYDHESLIKVLK